MFKLESTNRGFSTCFCFTILFCFQSSRGRLHLAFRFVRYLRYVCKEVFQASIVFNDKSALLCNTSSGSSLARLSPSFDLFYRKEISIASYFALRPIRIQYFVEKQATMELLQHMRVGLLLVVNPFFKRTNAPGRVKEMSCSSNLDMKSGIWP